MKHHIIIIAVLAGLFVLNAVAFANLFRIRKYGSLIFILTLFCSCAIVIGFFHNDLTYLLRRFRSGIPIYGKTCSCNSANFDLPKVDYYGRLLPLLHRRFPDMYLYNESTLKALEKKGKITIIDDQPGFVINRLQHSSPYLHVRSHALLTELGSRFRAELQRSGISTGYFRVNSVSRTVAQQEIIRKNNPLTASKSKSAHSYCVAVDISSIYVGNQSCAVGIRCLEKVLREMLAEGKVLLTPESTNLHVTFIPR
jgi:Family of unknown function (DUF5715)